jgi:hypothetical protein
VIARNGQVEQVWAKVKPEEHAKEVFKWLGSSQAEDRQDEMEYRTLAPNPPKPTTSASETPAKKASSSAKKAPAKKTATARKK